MKLHWETEYLKIKAKLVNFSIKSVQFALDKVEK